MFAKLLVVRLLYMPIFARRGTGRFSTEIGSILYEQKGVPLRAKRRRFIRFDKNNKESIASLFWIVRKKLIKFYANLVFKFCGTSYFIFIRQ